MPSRLLLLGAPRVETSGQLKPLRLNNPTSLLIYLAVRRDWLSRSELAYLYRPDEDEVTALKHVRLLLYRAKQYAWAKTLETDKKRVRFVINTDVRTFEHALETNNWRTALESYTNPFLAGCSLPEAPTYSAWVELERSELETVYQDALASYAATLEAQGNFDGATKLLGELLKRDAFAEEVVQAYLRNSYLAGHRSRALKAYDDFAKALREEFGAEPLEATRHLVDKVRAAEVIDARSTAPIPLKPSAASKLPVQSTRFVGRVNELETATETLAQPDCRLLTLVGLGGTGKTRLAVELARRLETRFAAGVYFVALAALNSAEAFIATLAQALGLTLSPYQDPQREVSAYLADKELLLVLDNFEHLLAAVPTLSELLESGDKLKFLVTSRESLKLKGEWLFDVGGLDYPQGSSASTREDGQPRSATDLAGYDAVTLFINSAKRVTPRLQLTGEDLQHVARVCEQVEGLPLALELAASWTRIMPVERIARELEDSHDLLEAQHTDLPERHRNLKAILDETWQRLSEQKRDALASFSVFQGGCTLEAAEAITGASLSLFLSLVNEALLLRSQRGRFDMHPLVKGYAYDRLQARPEQLGDVQRNHAHYYQQALEHVQLSLKTTSKEKLQTVTQELANMMSAWNYLARRRHLESLDRLNEAVYTYFFTTGRFGEGRELFTTTNALLDEGKTTPPLARLKLSEGRFWQRLGEPRKAERIFKTALALAKEKCDLRVTATAYSYIGDCHYELGDYAETRTHYETAEYHYRELDDWRGLARTNNVLGNLAKREGEFDLARTHFRKSLEAFTELDDPRGRATALNNMANLSEVQGDYREAEVNYLDCLDVFEKMDFKRGVAVVKNNLGIIYLRLGDFGAAKAYALESLELKRLLKDPLSIALGQATLADILTATGDFEQAKIYVLQAFTTALEREFIPLIAESAPTLIKLCHHAGAYEPAVSLVDALLVHPNSTPKLKQDVRSYKREPTKPMDVRENASSELTKLVKEVVTLLS